MTLLSRCLIATGVIIAGFVVQGVLYGHLESADRIKPGALLAPLNAFPHRVGNWGGVDTKMAESVQYADQHVQREYRNAELDQSLMLWMVYSSVGEDRGHHPEVCMSVAGQPEDRSARETISVPPHAAPIQQYRFGYPGAQQLVYYWHYTLPSPDKAQLNPLQQLYSRFRQRPASVTIQVFARHTDPENIDNAVEFVKLVDAEIQKMVGPHAIRGSHRMPVTVVPGEDPNDAAAPQAAPTSTTDDVK